MQCCLKDSLTSRASMASAEIWHASKTTKLAVHPPWANYPTTKSWSMRILRHYSTIKPITSRRMTRARLLSTYLPAWIHIVTLSSMAQSFSKTGNSTSHQDTIAEMTINLSMPSTTLRRLTMHTQLVVRTGIIRDDTPLTQSGWKRQRYKTSNSIIMKIRPFMSEKNKYLSPLCEGLATAILMMTIS